MGDSSAPLACYSISQLLIAIFFIASIPTPWSLNIASASLGSVETDVSTYFGLRGYSICSSSLSDKDSVTCRFIVYPDGDNENDSVCRDAGIVVGVLVGAALLMTVLSLFWRFLAGCFCRNSNTCTKSIMGLSVILTLVCSITAVVYWSTTCQTKIDEIAKSSISIDFPGILSFKNTSIFGP
jgi:hypothetical protein